MKKRISPALRRFSRIALAATFGIVFAACKTPPPSPPPAGEYFVSAQGSDRSDGFTEGTAFRSLFKALSMAGQTGTRLVTVVGRLDLASEQSSNAERVFLIQGTGKEEIVIRGKSGGTLSGGGGRRTLLVRGVCNIRLEDIAVTEGKAEGEGGGMGIGEGACVTLGPGAVVSGNESAAVGGGIAAALGGKVVLAGGEVSGNVSRGVGGGIAVVGKESSLKIESGAVKNNRAEGGGGVAAYEEAAFIFSGGEIADNQANVAGGGVVLNRGAVFTMEGGALRNNKTTGTGGADGSGGGMALLEKSVFILKGGEIAGNSSGAFGGAIACDDTSSIEMSGGEIKANSAGQKGGGIFVTGTLAKKGGILYGKEPAPQEGESPANLAPEGAAAYLYKGGWADEVRDATADEKTIIDSETPGAAGGWTAHQSDENQYESLGSLGEELGVTPDENDFRQ